MPIVPAKIRKQFAGKRITLGRPALPWTTEQDIQLINLVAETDVLWKDIAAAIAAESFTPSSGTCRSRFKQITGLQLADFRIPDPHKKAQRKKLSIQAFFSQRPREDFSNPTNPTNPTPLIPDLSHSIEGHDSIRRDRVIATGLNTVFNNENNYGQSNSGNQATPDLSSPGLLSRAATTPADSSQAFLTPIVETFTGRIASSNNLSPDYGDYNTPGTLYQNTTIQRPESLSHKKSLVVDNDTFWASDYLQDAPLDSVVPQSLESTNGADDIWRPGGDSLQIDSIVTSPKRSSPPDTISKTSAAVPKLQIAKTIADKQASVEDRTLYPRGFLAHVRAGLRDSVPSLVSSGTRRSRWSFRRTSRIVPSVFPASRLSSENISGGQSGQRVYLTPHSLALVDLLTQSTAPADQISIAVSHLLAEGADVNCRNASDQMPLHLALDRGLHRVCKILLDKGADVYAKTSDGAKLSDHGRAILDNSIHDPRQYAAIRLCRHFIRLHNPPHQTTPIRGIEGAEIHPFRGIGGTQNATSVNIEDSATPVIAFGSLGNSVPRLNMPPLLEQHSQSTNLNGSVFHGRNVQTEYEPEPGVLDATSHGSQTSFQAIGTYNERHSTIHSNKANEQLGWSSDQVDNYRLGSSHTLGLDPSAFQQVDEPHRGAVEHAEDFYGAAETTFPSAESGADRVTGLELSKDGHVAGPHPTLYDPASNFPFPVGMISEGQGNLQMPVTLSPHVRRLRTGEIALIYVLSSPSSPRPGLQLMLQDNAPVLSHVPYMAWMQPSGGVLDSPTHGRMIAADVLPTLSLDESTNAFDRARREGPASDSLTNRSLSGLIQPLDTWNNTYLTNDPTQR